MNFFDVLFLGFSLTSRLSAPSAGARVGLEVTLPLDGIEVTLLVGGKMLGEGVFVVSSLGLRKLIHFPWVLLRLVDVLGDGVAAVWISWLPKMRFNIKMNDEFDESAGTLVWRRLLFLVEVLLLITGLAGLGGGAV